jgi:hypothetical protein
VGLLAIRLVFRRAALDARLARGDELAANRALALRAGQLGSARTRRSIAAGLDRALTDGDGRFSAAVPVDRRAVARARPYLAAIIELLRSPNDVAPHGVARASRMLTDVASPLYASDEPTALRDESRMTLFWLDPAPNPANPTLSETTGTSSAR